MKRVQSLLLGLVLSAVSLAKVYAQPDIASLTSTPSTITANQSVVLTIYRRDAAHSFDNDCAVWIGPSSIFPASYPNVAPTGGCYLHPIEGISGSFDGIFPSGSSTPIGYSTPFNSAVTGTQINMTVPGYCIPTGGTYIVALNNESWSNTYGPVAGWTEAGYTQTVTVFGPPSITATSVTPASPEAAGTTGVQISATTSINATCTADGTAFQSGQGTTSHLINISGLTNGFNHSYSVVCTANGVNSAASNVNVAVAPNITATSVTPASPEVAGTTGVQISATTDINTTCTADGTAFQSGQGTTSHLINISGLTNGFNHSYSVVCTANGVNSAASAVNVAVAPNITATSVFPASPEAAGTTGVQISATTDINTSCTADGTAFQSGQGTTSHLINISGLYNGFNHNYSVVCTANGVNSAASAVNVAVAPNITATSVFPASPEVAGTTGVQISVTSDINTSCTADGTTFQSGQGTTSHLINISGLYNGFNHNYSVICTANGVNSSASTVNVTVNYAAPNITATSVTPASPEPAGTTGVQISATTDLVSSCTLDGTAFQSGQGTTSHLINISGLTNGFNHSYSVVCTANGVNSAASNVNVTVKYAAPNVTATSVTPASPEPAGTTGVQISATTDLVSSCTLDGTAFQSGQGTTGHLINISNLTNGFNHNYSVVCSTDGLNSSASNVNVTVKYAAPNITATSVTPASPEPAGTTGVQISATTDLVSSCTLDGTAFQTGQGTTSHLVNISNLTNGFNHNYSVICSTQGLNSTPSAVNVTVKYAAPNITATSVTPASPEPAGTTGVQISATTDLVSSCTIDGTAFQSGQGTTSHLVNISNLTNGFNHNYSVICSTQGLNSTPSAVNVTVKYAAPKISTTSVTPASPEPAGTTGVQISATTDLVSSCTIDGTAFQTGQGTTSHLVNISNLTNGFNHNYSVVCSTHGLNSSTSTVNVTVNSAGPQITATSVVPPSPEVAGTTGVQISATTDIKSSCTIGGTAFQSGQGTTSHLVNISGLTNGFNHNYSVVCSANGQSSSTSTVNVTVNNYVAPKISTTSVTPASPEPAGTTGVQISATTDLVSSCTIDGTAFQTGQGTTSHLVNISNLTNGFNHNYSVICSTHGLNSSASIVNVTVNSAALNITATSVTPASPEPAGTTGVQISATTDQVSSCTIDGAAFQTGQGTTSHLVNISNLTNGFNHNYSVICSTKGLNSSASIVNVTVNYAAPNITATSVTPPSPEVPGTTGVQISATTDIKSSCTIDGTAFQTGQGTTSHLVNISNLTNGFNHNYSVICSTHGLNSSASIVNVTVSTPIQISGPELTNGQKQKLTSPLMAGTTAVNVLVGINIPATCTIAGKAGTAPFNNATSTGVWVTLTGLYDGFSDTYTITCQDQTNAANTVSKHMPLAVSQPSSVLQIISAAMTNASNQPATSPLPSGTKAINVIVNTNIASNCTITGVSGTGTGSFINSGPSSLWVTITGLYDGFREEYAIVCRDPNNTSNQVVTGFLISVNTPAKKPVPQDSPVFAITQAAYTVPYDNNLMTAWYEATQSVPYGAPTVEFYIYTNSVNDGIINHCSMNYNGQNYYMPGGWMNTAFISFGTPLPNTIAATNPNYVSEPSPVPVNHYAWTITCEDSNYNIATATGSLDVALCQNDAQCAGVGAYCAAGGICVPLPFASGAPSFGSQYLITPTVVIDSPTAGATYQVGESLIVDGATSGISSTTISQAQFNILMDGQVVATMAPGSPYQSLTPFRQGQIGSHQISAVISLPNTLDINGQPVVVAQSQSVPITVNPATPCTDSSACDAGNYCASASAGSATGACVPIPLAAVAVSTPPPGAIYSVSDATDVFSYTQNGSSVSASLLLLQLGTQIEMNGSFACLGASADSTCAIIIPNTDLVVLLSSPIITGDNSLSALAFVTDVAGNLFPVGQSSPFDITARNVPTPTTVIISTPTPAYGAMSPGSDGGYSVTINNPVDGSYSENMICSAQSGVTASIPASFCVGSPCLTLTPTLSDASGSYPSGYTFQSGDSYVNVIVTPSPGSTLTGCTMETYGAMLPGGGGLYYREFPSPAPGSYADLITCTTSAGSASTFVNFNVSNIAVAPLALTPIISDSGGAYSTGHTFPTNDANITLSVIANNGNTLNNCTMPMYLTGVSYQFSATVLDQNNKVMNPKPGISWLVVQPGVTIDASGHFTATNPGIYMVIAISGGGIAVASVDVTVSPNPGTPSQIQVASASSDLSSVRVYPNPWKSTQSVSQMTFDQMPANSTVKIFSVSGRLVKTLSAPNGSTTWDLTNDSGQKVASGLYIYLIADGQGNKAHGKLTVIR